MTVPVRTRSIGMSSVSSVGFGNAVTSEDSSASHESPAATVFVKAGAPAETSEAEAPIPVSVGFRKVLTARIPVARITSLSPMAPSE